MSQEYCRKVGVCHKIAGEVGYLVRVWNRLLGASGVLKVDSTKMNPQFEMIGDPETIQEQAKAVGWGQCEKCLVLVSCALKQHMNSHTGIDFISCDKLSAIRKYSNWQHCT